MERAKGNGEITCHKCFVDWFYAFKKLWTISEVRKGILALRLQQLNNCCHSSQSWDRSHHQKIVTFRYDPRSSSSARTDPRSVGTWTERFSYGDLVRPRTKARLRNPGSINRVSLLQAACLTKSQLIAHNYRFTVVKKILLLIVIIK